MFPVSESLAMNRPLQLHVWRAALPGVVLILISQMALAQGWRTMTRLPGVDLSGLDQRRQDMVLHILREEDCPCGCNMKLAQCRVEDQQCPVSPKLVSKVVLSARQGHSSVVIRSSLVSELSPEQLNQELSVKRVRAAALSQKMEEPKFILPENGKREYWYDFGPSLYGRREVPEYSALAMYPIGLQHTVETLRKFRPGNFWTPYLNQVESIVQQQINLLRNTRIQREAMARQVRTLSIQAYQILDNAVIQYAQSQGWTAKLSIKAPAAGPSVSVAVSVQPAGATVYYLSEYQFRTTAKLGLKAIRDFNRNWNRFGRVNNNVAAQAKLPISGAVRFYAVWPNGREEMSLVDLLPPRERPLNQVSLRAL